MKIFQQNRTGIVVASLAALALSGCVGMELETAKGLEAKGDAFSKELYPNYIRMSESEYKEGDYRDSDTFAMRAKKAAAGAPSALEETSARDIPAAYKGEIAMAYRQLNEVFSKGARSKAPDWAAQAQTTFECWMQEIEENHQPEDWQSCKDRFEVALKMAQHAVMDKPVPAKKEMAAEKPMKKFVNFTVYFSHDSAGLSPEALDTISQAAKAAGSMSASMITVSGYTDRSGSAEYNMGLSERRARNVSSALDDFGASGKMDMKYFGEKNNKVRTKDGVRRAENRRAKIEIRR